MTRFETYFVAAIQGLLANEQIYLKHMRKTDLLFHARDIALDAMDLADRQIGVDQATLAQDIHESTPAAET